MPHYLLLSLPLNYLLFRWYSYCIYLWIHLESAGSSKKISLQKETSEREEGFHRAGRSKYNRRGGLCVFSLVSRDIQLARGSWSYELFLVGLSVRGMHRSARSLGATPWSALFTRTVILKWIWAAKDNQSNSEDISCVTGNWRKRLAAAWTGRGHKEGPDRQQIIELQ